MNHPKDKAQIDPAAASTDQQQLDATMQLPQAENSSESDATAAFDSGSIGTSPSGSHPSRSSPATVLQPREHSIKTIGSYRLTEVLGEGGMGRVYKGMDKEDRAVAVKLLSPKWAASPDALERFKQEGFIASQINHPHCVFVHQVDEEQGVPFIAMELMSGQTLKDLVLQRGPLPYREAVALILQCIEGLIETHSRGMIHRDIKPANCYLDEQGNVKIGDFGLARSLVDDSELTRTGTFIGTPLFASPEQVLGQPIDTQSDIYSLSATLYYLLAGKAPFESPNAAQVIAKIASMDPPAFDELQIKVPKVLQSIVMKGLTRDRSKRYASFEQMRADLLPIIAPKEEVASIGRRVVASIIDSFAISFLTSVIMISFFALSQMQRLSPLLTTLIGSSIAFSYFFLCEGSFGMTLGKRILRLKVVDSHSGSRASWYRVALRALAFIGFVNGLETILYTIFRDISPFLTPLFSWGGQFLGYGLLFLTWRRTQKRQLTHEFLSQTETRVVTFKRTMLPSRFYLIDWQPRFSDSNPIPAKCGRYTVYGRLETEEDQQWWMAEDPALERRVWIHVLGSDQDHACDDRRNLVVRNRQRFIESGTHESQRWDAYLAPQGIPLISCLEDSQELPWPVAREVLHQVMQEYEKPENERIPTSYCSLSRLWVDELGRITFAEAGIKTTSMQPTQSFAKLMQQIAMVAIPTAHPLRKHSQLKAKAPANPISAQDLPPLRGLSLLERLLRQTPGNEMAMPAIAQEIKLVDQAPASVTASTRFTHAAAVGLVLSPAFFLVFLLTCINGVLVHTQLRKEARNLRTLSEVVAKPEDHAPILGQMQDVDPSWLRPESAIEIFKAAEYKQAQSMRVYRGLTSLERMMIGQIPGADSELEQLPKPIPLPPTPRSEDGSTTLPAVPPQPPRTPTVRFEEKDAKIRFGKGEMIEITPNSITEDASELAGKLKKSLTHWKQDKDSLTDPFLFPTGRFASYVIAGLILWTGILKGGLIQLFTGIFIMDRRGYPIGFLRHILRAIYLYIPLLIVSLVLMLLANMGVDGVVWTSQLNRFLFIVPVMYLASTLIWPQAAPHDRLSGTIAVPR
ncbi:MAG: protein kinase [Pirellulales bacterium]